MDPEGRQSAGECDAGENSKLKDPEERAASQGFSSAG
jgi:hypothetical protein